MSKDRFQESIDLRTAGPGDKLARGAQSVTYTSGSAGGVGLNEPGVKDDLQNLTKDEFLDKYFDRGVGEVHYDHLIESLAAENEPEALPEAVPDVSPNPIVRELVEQARKSQKPLKQGVPVGDNILVMPDVETAEASAGGIVIPKNAQSKVNMGTVVAVGEGWRDRATGVLYPCRVHEGQYIVYNQFAAHGKEIELFGGKLLLITDMDVMLVLEDVSQEEK